MYFYIHCTFSYLICLCALFIFSISCWFKKCFSNSLLSIDRHVLHIHIFQTMGFHCSNCYSSDDLPCVSVLFQSKLWKLKRESLATATLRRTWRGSLPSRASWMRKRAEHWTTCLKWLNPHKSTFVVHFMVTLQIKENCFIQTLSKCKKCICIYIVVVCHCPCWI